MGSSNKGYQFTIQNGVVTAVFKLENGRIKRDPIDHDETWSLSGSNIIKTENEHGRIKTTVYADSDGDGIFTKLSASSTGSTDGYQFSIQGGSVNAVYEVEHGQTRAKPFEANETWSLSGAQVVKTEVKRGGIETSTYADADGDGIYTKISETYAASSGSALPRPEAPDAHHAFGLTRTGSAAADLLRGGDGKDVLQGGAGDDVLIGDEGADELAGGAGADRFVFREVEDSGLLAGNRDRIIDFQQGDKIDLSAIDAKLGQSFNDAFSFIGSASQLNASNANGAVWFENGVLYASTDFDTAPEMAIELVGVSSLTAADLVL